MKANSIQIKRFVNIKLYFFRKASTIGSAVKTKVL